MKTGKMVLLAALVLFLGAYSAPAATIIVNPGDSIQAAISGAPNGSTIKIKAGTYTEEITIANQSGLKLIGAGAGKTIIDGIGRTGDVVTINNSKKITLQQCTIRSGGNNNVVINSSHRVKILRNWILHAANYGIAGTGTKLLIQGNGIADSGQDGIYVRGYHTLIVKNIILRNGVNGITDYGTSDKIIKNIVGGNNTDGIAIGGGSVTTQLNTVTDNGGFGIREAEAIGSAHQNVYMKNTVQRNVAGGILVSAGAMVIKNTVTDNTGDGIDGAWSGNTLISNIIKDNSGMGIYLVADGHYLKGNLVTGNGGRGIYIDASGTTGMSQVLKNKVLNNGSSGIMLDGCNLSIVSNNFCAGNSTLFLAAGIYGGTGSMAVIYTKNKVNNNAAGMTMTGGGIFDYVARNVVANNPIFGIHANGGQMMTFEKNVIIGNGPAGGLLGFGSSLVSKNRILNNTGNGIDASASSGSASLIERNIVKGNGDGASTFDLYDSTSPTDDWWQKNQYLTESL
ncbi:hypothetical protein BMS3Bbin14_00191 [bacterium BMS3Bbin14]|nr:hypothetical protein BMS3Bbin14_00191 [bacterium BMS3Bbin14]